MRFFNTENKWRATMQAANGLALMVSAYKMFSNPETAWENGFEIALHALNFVTFSTNDNALTSIGNAALNFSSLGAIYAGVTSGCSGTSVKVNMFDALLHLTNAVTSICYKTNPENNREITPSTASIPL
ncbi:MAG: hypothetical protein HYX60_10410 [Legionella longbeachae]|nr:hypothetical protein [Legionella longbeachae]